jgi:D-alanyl-D-alanine carboxypeptidase
VTRAAIEAVATAAAQRFLGAHPSVPGVVLRAESGAGTVSVAAGYEDAERTTPMTADAPFRIASNTKTYVAAAVLRLIERGEVELEGPIAPLLPGSIVELLARGGYDAAAITVRQLLQHTSGIADHSRADTGEYAGSSYLLALQDSPRHRWSPREQIAFSVDRFAPIHPPGAGWEYTDTGYVTLAIVLETVTELPLAAALRTLCRLDALGLRSTWLESLEAPRSARSICRHYFGDWEVTGLDPSADLYGGGGLVSTTADLIAFWRALFGSEVYERPGTLASMLDPLAPGSEKLGEAGLGLFRRVLGGALWWGHTGFWGSGILHDPARGISVAVFRNQSLVGAGDVDAMLAPILAAHDDAGRRVLQGPHRAGDGHHLTVGEREQQGVRDPVRATGRPPRDQA